MPLNATRRVFLLTLPFAHLVLSKSWDTPAFPSWSPTFIDKLITDSPWAKQSTVRVDLDTVRGTSGLTTSSFSQLELPTGIGFPRGGSGIPGVGWPRGGGGATPGNRMPPIGGPSSGGGGRNSGATGEIFLTTRWASALPIRQAQTLQQFGRGRLETPEAADRLNTQPEDYVLEIAGFPATIVRERAAKFAAELKDTARLTVLGRKPLAATASNMPEPGMHLMATLSFPRFEHLAQHEGSIEFSATIRGMQLRQRFKLGEMVYGDRLEL
jgi:hypothetical protein